MKFQTISTVLVSVVYAISAVCAADANITHSKSVSAVFSTYLGGSLDDAGFDCVAAPANNDCAQLIGALDVGCSDEYHTWYVSSTGDDATGDGSYIYPYATIQHAVNMAADSDTVLIFPGNYYDTQWAMVDNRRLTIGAEDENDRPIIHNETGGRVLSITGTSEIWIQGLVISGGNPMDPPGGGVSVESSIVNIVNCSFSGWHMLGGGLSAINSHVTANNSYFSGVAYSMGGGVYCSGGYLRFDSCTIQNAHFYEMGGGIYAACDSVTIENSVVSRNSRRNYLDPQSGGGIYLIGNNFRIENCRIDSNSIGRYDEESFGASGGGLCISGNNGIIRNNSIRYNTMTANVLSDLMPGIARGAGLYLTGNTNLIENNDISHNIASAYGRAFATAEAAGLYINDNYGGGNTMVTGNLIVANRAYAATAFNHGPRSEVIGAGCSFGFVNAIVSNNTVADNNGYAVAEEFSADYPCVTICRGGGCYAETGISLDNNIFAYNEVLSNCLNHINPDNIADSLSGAGIFNRTNDNDCNLYFGNIGAEEWTGMMSATTINADPQFCDTADGNFRISPFSPCAPDNNSCDSLIGAEEVGCAYLPGDPGGDGEVNIGDAVYLINYIFKEGPPPVPLGAGDPNADCAINIGDAVYLINYIFRGGPPPQIGCAE